MTNQGKYEKGLELEAEGKTGEQIAKALGLSGRQAWYDLKYTQKKQNDAFNRRAAQEKSASDAIEKTRMQLADKTRLEQEAARQAALKAINTLEEKMAMASKGEDETVVIEVPPSAPISIPKPEKVTEPAPFDYKVDCEITMTGTTLDYKANPRGIEFFDRKTYSGITHLKWEQVEELQKGLTALKEIWTETWTELNK